MNMRQLIDWMQKVLSVNVQCIQQNTFNTLNIIHAFWQISDTTESYDLHRIGHVTCFTHHWLSVHQKLKSLVPTVYIVNM